MLLDGGGKGRKTLPGRQMMLGGSLQSSELHSIAIRLAVLIFSEIPGRERTALQFRTQGFIDNFTSAIVKFSET